MKLDVVRAVEACYATTPDDGWLPGVLEALAPLDRGGGLVAGVYRTGGAAALEVECSAVRGSLAGRFAAGLHAALRNSPPDELARLLAPEPAVEYATRRAVRAGAAFAREVRALLVRLDADDALSVVAAGPSGRTALISAIIPVGRPYPGPRISRQLALFSAHLGSALRLRATLPASAAQEGFAAAARRLAEARLGARRSDPDDAQRLWSGLVGGTWSLVDSCDADGGRYVLARRNDPGVRDPKALTARERAVLALAASGHQNKSIAYLLGVSRSGVARHLESARRKLALSSRAELVRRFAALVDGRCGPALQGASAGGARAIRAR